MKYAIQKKFVEFEPIRVIAIQKRNRNNANAPLKDGSLNLRVKRPLPPDAYYEFRL